VRTAAASLWQSSPPVIHSFCSQMDDNEPMQMLKMIRGQRDDWRPITWVFLVAGLGLGGLCWYQLSQLYERARNSGFIEKYPEAIEPVLMAVVYATLLFAVGLLACAIANWRLGRIEDAVLALLAATKEDTDRGAEPEDGP